MRHVRGVLQGLALFVWASGLGLPAQADTRSDLYTCSRALDYAELGSRGELRPFRTGGQKGETPGFWYLTSEHLFFVAPPKDQLTYIYLENQPPTRIIDTDCEGACAQKVGYAVTSGDQRKAVETCQKNAARFGAQHPPDLVDKLKTRGYVENSALSAKSCCLYTDPKDGKTLSASCSDKQREGLTREIKRLIGQGSLEEAYAYTLKGDPYGPQANPGCPDDSGYKGLLQACNEIISRNAVVMNDLTRDPSAASGLLAMKEGIRDRLATLLQKAQKNQLSRCRGSASCRSNIAADLAQCDSSLLGEAGKENVARNHLNKLGKILSQPSRAVATGEPNAPAQKRVGASSAAD